MLGEKKLVDCAIFNKFVTQYCISLSWVHVTQVGEAVSGILFWY
jgi:hypothetical protein